MDLDCGILNKLSLESEKARKKNLKKFKKVLDKLIKRCYNEIPPRKRAGHTEP